MSGTRATTLLDVRETVVDEVSNEVVMLYRARRASS